MKYKRILLKLSGESLMGKDRYGIDPERLEEYALQIKEIAEMGVETGIVIGGGNIFRGLKGMGQGFDRVDGDYMGMLATVINSLALKSALKKMNITGRVLTAIHMEPVGQPYTRERVLEAFANHEVVIFSGGTGNPYFTTDTASTLRAVEMDAEVVLKGTRVDGIYSDDPEKNPEAVKFDRLTFQEAYDQNLKIMDLTAFTMCRENDIEILVFNMNKKGNLKKIILGENIGTLVKN